MPSFSKTTHADAASPSTSPASSQAAAERRVIINELLSYVQFYHDSGNAAALHRIASGFYTAAEISAAKKCFISVFQPLVSGCPFITERRNSVARQAHDVELEDILGLFGLLDDKNQLESVIFAAVNHDRVPCFGPEKINICEVVNRQVRADADLERLSKQVAELSGRDVRETTIDVSASMNELSTKISLLMDSMEAQSQRIPVHESPQIHSSARSTQNGDARIQRQEVDRSHNIVVTGIPEDKNPNIWRSKVASILHIVAGHDIQVVDAFRLGRFRTDRIRPILIKLHSIWDKRMVLSNTHALIDHEEYRRSVYIRADEPVDVRRKRMLKSLYHRARWQGHNAEISNDGSKLSIDGAIVYTLNDGHVVDVANATASDLRPNDAD